MQFKRTVNRRVHDLTALVCHHCSVQYAWANFSSPSHEQACHPSLHQGAGSDAPQEQSCPKHPVEKANFLTSWMLIIDMTFDKADILVGAGVVNCEKLRVADPH